MSREKWAFGLTGAIALALSLTATSARSQAARVRTCTTTSLANMVIGNADCPNLEPVTLTSGMATTCLQAVVDANGGAHADGQIVGQGVGANTSGDQYLFHIDALVSINLSSGGASNETVLGTAELIGQGPAPNELADVLGHITVDANGNLTAVVDRIVARCQP